MKKKVNYNVSESIIKDFNELAKKKAINKSQLIENFIEGWVEKNK